MFVTGPMGRNYREECSSGAAAAAVAAAGWRSNYFMRIEKWTHRTVLDIGQAGDGAVANVTLFAAREMDFAYPGGEMDSNVTQYMHIDTTSRRYVMERHQNPKSL